MKILLIGANGQLGTDLRKVLDKENLLALTHQDIEITDCLQVKAVFAQFQPRIVIDTAAYHKLDECQKNPDKAFQVNAVGTRNVALVCKEMGIKMVFISTDYVFDGEKTKPYLESDTPNPLNVYGVSKLAGELFVRNILKEYFIVRTSGLFGVAGSSGKGGNFIELMLKLAQEKKEIRVVDDLIFSPTYTLDLACKIYELIKTEKFGIYHIINKGECSWYQFAKKIFQISNLHPNLKRTTTEEFGVFSTRPKYSVLKSHHLGKISLCLLRSWEEALEAYLEERRKEK